MVGLQIDELVSDRYRGPKVGIVSCVEANRRPTENDTKYPVLTMWRVGMSSDPMIRGEVHQLAGFNKLGEAVWLQIRYEAGAGSISILINDDEDEITPDAYGEISLSADVGNGDPVRWITTSGNDAQLTIGVAKALDRKPHKKNNVGMSSYDSRYFDVSAHGHVELNISSLPGGWEWSGDNDEVLADKEGRVFVTGDYSYKQSRPLSVIVDGNRLKISSQLAQVLSSDVEEIELAAGACSFSTDHFDVERGHVRIKRDADAIQTITGDRSGSIKEIDRLVPENGAAYIRAVTVPSCGVPMKTTTYGDTLVVEAQRAGVVDCPSKSVCDQGVAAFNKSQFISEQGNISLRSPHLYSHTYAYNLDVEIVNGEKIKLISKNGDPLSSSNPGYINIADYMNEPQMITEESVVYIGSDEEVCYDYLREFGEEIFPLFVGFRAELNGRLSFELSRHDHNAFCKISQVYAHVEVWDEGDKKYLILENEGKVYWSFSLGKKLLSEYSAHTYTYTPEFEFEKGSYYKQHDGKCYFEYLLRNCEREAVGNDLLCLKTVYYGHDLNGAISYKDRDPIYVRNDRSSEISKHFGHITLVDMRGRPITLYDFEIGSTLKLEGWAHLWVR